jgi:hypothetical protein
MKLKVANSAQQQVELIDGVFVGDAELTKQMTLYYQTSQIGVDFGSWLQGMSEILRLKVEYVPDEIPEGIVK